MKVTDVIANRRIQHLLFWLAFLFFNFLLTSNSELPFWKSLLWILGSLPCIMGLVYLHLWVLVPRLLLRGRYSLFMIIFICVAIAYVLLERFLNYHVFWPLFIDQPLNRTYRYLNLVSLSYNAMYQYSVVFLAILIRSVKQWYESQQRRKELELQNRNSELALLRMQINPHFLFNTLNNIHALINIEKDKAAEALVMLSDIMRYMLYDANTENVPLDQEIRYLESYLVLQKIRLAEPDLVSFSVEGNTNGKVIAPVILIPFVENAFKHGVKDDVTQGIHFRIILEDHSIIFESENAFRSWTGGISDKTGGLGLENVRRRLELLYPGRYLLEIADQDDHFRVHLEIMEEVRSEGD